MTVHNYRSRQVHETLNGVNPSSGFRDMRSAKSGPNLWQIWQVFGPWASPYGANGQMSITVHNYRPRQFHRTSNGENPSSGYRDMGSASLAAARPTARPPARPTVRPPARPPGPWRQYPSSPEGSGVKRCDGQTDGPTDGRTDRQTDGRTENTICRAAWSQLKTRRSENDNTPQPLDQWTNSPFMGQQVGNCKSFKLAHSLVNLFAMHCDPRESPSWIRHYIQLASLLFQVDQPSHS